MSTYKKVVVMSDDEESSDYDKKNQTFNSLERNFRVIQPSNASPESTVEPHTESLPREKPKRNYRKKTSKEKEEAKQDRERKRSQKKEGSLPVGSMKLDASPEAIEVNSSSTVSYTRLLEDNNRVIRELLTKVNAYEEILTEMGHNPIQLWKSRTL
jgi:hypothetical protein